MKMRRYIGRTVLLLIAALFFFLAFGAQDDELTIKHPKVQRAIEVQEAVTPDLMSVEDVLGTAVGEDEDGEVTVIIYVNLEGKNPVKTFKSMPGEIKGVRTRVEFTEPFREMVAKGKPGGGGASHTAIQNPPIQLGTSGGWAYDLANGYCCGGTLGALIQIGKNQYILSNYHVFEADIVSGGNTRIAQTGDPIIQPGLIDVGCNAANAQSVASLQVKHSLPNSNVDASIAQIIPGMVSDKILEIGTISSSTVDARINQAVKKSGRTTGLSTSKVSGLNATVSVTYENECAGGTAFTRTFTGQIIIANRGSKFLNSGDSGSLMVENVSTNPRAVGLLFAGNSTLAVANPIGEVLTWVGAQMGGTASMVGQ